MTQKSADLICFAAETRNNARYYYMYKVKVKVTP